MPQINNNLTGEPWRTCDRCGFLHPVGMLRKQLGMMVCEDHGCADDISNDRRPMLIARILPGAVKNESINPIAERLKDKGEVLFDGSDK